MQPVSGANSPPAVSSSHPPTLKGSDVNDEGMEKTPGILSQDTVSPTTAEPVELMPQHDMHIHPSINGQHELA